MFTATGRVRMWRNYGCHMSTLKNSQAISLIRVTFCTVSSSLSSFSIEDCCIAGCKNTSVVHFVVTWSYTTHSRPHGYKYYEHGSTTDHTKTSRGPQWMVRLCVCFVCWFLHIHSKFRSITSAATKVHVILWSFVVLTCMRDIIELV